MKVHKKDNINPDNKIPKKLLLRAIRQKFDSHEELGKALGGIKKQAVSGAINRQSDKFLEKLEKLGIDLSTINRGDNNITNSNFKAGGDQKILSEGSEEQNSILLNNIISQLSDFGNRIRKLEEFVDRVKEHPGKPIPGEGRH